MKSPILGVAYAARSPNLAAQRCINLYPEIVETKNGKEVGAFYGTPGLQYLMTVDGGPIRGMRVTNNGQTLNLVSGSNAYTVNTNYVATMLGSVGNDGKPVSLSNNPTQVAISSAGTLYSVVGGVLNAVSIPFTSCGILAEQDGFVVATQPGTFNIWQSNLNDLTTWNALNFSTADGQSDNIVAVAEFHRQLVIFKQYHTEFWINAGVSGFVFQRLQGVFIETGCMAPYSVSKSTESLLWLGQTSRGFGSVYLMEGYQPRRVSTHAMEYAWAKYGTMSDAIGFCYQQEGHSFYCLTFPTGNETWVLDLTASEQFKEPVWHQRAYFSNGAFSRYLAQNAVNFNGQVIVGDYSSGNLYTLNMGYYLDNGNPRKWLRSWRAKPTSSEKTSPYRRLEIDMESGIGVPQSANPQIVLRYTDDAHNWSSEHYVSAGTTGNTSGRQVFNRLGLERRGLGADRAFELSSTDQFKVSILGATIL